MSPPNRPRGPRSVADRYDRAIALSQRFGLEPIAPNRPPPGLKVATWATGRWRFRAVAPYGPSYYVELFEELDTTQSYPEPWQTYEYLIHVPDPTRRGRNVSFHKDRTKATLGLLYHWHDYPDGDRRGPPVAMSPISLRWFLDAAQLIFAQPTLPVPDLLVSWPPPGPGDPW